MQGRKTAKAATHRRIVASASRLMRRGGLARASVADVMRGAGLTVGGFYAHFRSKRAMDREVLEQTFADVRQRSIARLGGAEGVDWLARYVGHYLAAAHRDTPATGCPAPAVITDLTHADAALRRALGTIVERWSRRILAHAPPTRAASARQRALATIALCVGGLTLARSLRGQPLSDEILRACKAWAVPERAARATPSSSRRRRPPTRRRPSPPSPRRRSS